MYGFFSIFFGSPQNSLLTVDEAEYLYEWTKMKTTEVVFTSRDSAPAIAMNACLRIWQILNLEDVCIRILGMG